MKNTLHTALLAGLLLLAHLPSTQAADAPTGKLVGWGQQNNGNLANGQTTGTTTTPVDATATAFNGAAVTRVANGFGAGGCAIAGGKLYCWGTQGAGRLGNGVVDGVAANARTTPVPVCTTADTAAPCGDGSSAFSQLPATAVISDISLGGSHGCAVADGKAYCWGSQASGRLGNGQTVSGSIPTPQAVDVGASSALNGKTVTRITAGSDFTCALTSEGRAACWGNGSTSALGTGNVNAVGVPTTIVNGAIPGGALLTDISAGNAHTCAVASGRAYCWGQNNVPSVFADGRLGNNSSTASSLPVAVFTSASSTPSALPDSATVTQISAGGVHTCAIASGLAYCWGQDSSLGNGSSSVGSSTRIPVAVDRSGVLGGLSLTEVRTGQSSGIISGGACALSTAGLAYCWGNDLAVGDGRGTTGAVQTTPVAVQTSSPSALNGFRLRQIAYRASQFFVMGVTAGAATAPTALNATAGEGQVQLSFTAPSDNGGLPITNYAYSTNNGSSYTAFNPAVTASPVTITGLTNGTALQIKLRAVTPAGDGVQSAAVSATPVSAAAPGACGTAQNTATVSAPSTNLCATGTATTVSSTGGQWAWMCNGTGGNTVNTSCAAPFAAQRLSLTAEPTSILVNGSSALTAASTANLPPTLSTESSTCTLGPATGGTIVTANVTGTSAGTCTVQAERAISADGCTSCYVAASTTANITVSKADQTISPPSVSNSSIFVGGTSTVSATASSGLAVSYSTSPSTVCSNNGGTVTGVGAGNCTVTVSQAGNNAFNAAPVQTTSITVTAAPVAGVCGSAKTTNPTAVMPSGAGLCSAGVASQVTGSNGTWAWSCNGTSGGNSDTTCAAPYGTQTLSISALPNSIQVGQTSNITASSTASLAVTLAAGGAACSLSGTTPPATATGIEPGACSLTASQPGTGDVGGTRYVAATPASTPLTVSAAPTGPAASACDRFTTGANVIDLRGSPGGQTARGVNGQFNVIYGSAFADSLTGGGAGNCIDGGAGADRLTAGAGDNSLYGAEGNDTLTPGTGSTLMDGGAGTDRCGRVSGRATATYASCEAN